MTHGEAELHAGILVRRHVGSAGAHHRERVLQQGAQVDARGRGWHQPEWRQHGVTSADRWIAMEDACKTLSGCDLLQRRARVGDRDEVVAGLAGADRLGYAGEEIVLHHVRFGRAAGLAGDDEQGFGDVDRSLKVADLRGVGRVKHVQLRGPGF